MQGVALSFDEAYVAIVSARASDETTNGNFAFSLSNWSTSFNSKGFYNNTLNSDAYSALFHVLNVAGIGVIVKRLHYLRTAQSLSSATWYSSLWNVSANPTNSATYCCNLKNAAKNADGKLTTITIGTDMATSVKVGAGTRIEVWIR